MNWESVSSMESEGWAIQTWAEEAKILLICQHRLAIADRLCFMISSQHLWRKRILHINEAPQIHHFGIMGCIFEKYHKITKSTCGFFVITAKSAGHLPALVVKVLSAPSWRSLSTASCLLCFTAIDKAWRGKSSLYQIECSNWMKNSGLLYIHIHLGHWFLLHRISAGWWLYCSHSWLQTSSRTSET